MTHDRLETADPARDQEPVLSLQIFVACCASALFVAVATEGALAIVLRSVSYLPVWLLLVAIVGTLCGLFSAAAAALTSWEGLCREDRERTGSVDRSPDAAPRHVDNLFGIGTEIGRPGQGEGMSKIVTRPSRLDASTPAARQRGFIWPALLAGALVAILHRAAIIVFWSPSYWPLALVLEVVLALALGWIGGLASGGWYRRHHETRGWRLPAGTALIGAVVFVLPWTAYVVFSFPGQGWLVALSAPISVILVVSALLIAARAQRHDSDDFAGRGAT